MVLLNYWPKARCPEFADALLPLAQVPKEPDRTNDGSLRDWAFIRLGELRPGTVRPLILEDLQRAKPVLSENALRMLPDKELPELDGVLLAHLNDPKADIWKVAPMIERYASARILPQVIAFYQQKAEKGWACSLQAAFLRYWLKHDRPAALQAIEKAVTFRKSTRCYTSVLGVTLHDSWDADAEELVRKYIDDADPEVAANARKLLSQHAPGTASTGEQPAIAAGSAKLEMELSFIDLESPKFGDKKQIQVDATIRNLGDETVLLPTEDIGPSTFSDGAFAIINFSPDGYCETADGFRIPKAKSKLAIVELRPHEAIELARIFEKPAPTVVGAVYSISKESAERYGTWSGKIDGGFISLPAKK